MESVEFKVEQVNFDEDKLREKSGELDSFGNLINCNYTFERTREAEISVSPQLSFAERPAQSSGRSKRKNTTRITKCVSAPITSICENTEVQLDPPGSDHRDFNISTPIVTLQKVTNNSASLHSHLNTRGRRARILVHRPRPTMSDIAESDGGVFETVAEALHLQHSVIGDANLAPASPEAIAQAIAQAQKKMTPLKSSAVIQISDSGDTGDYNPETLPSPIVGFGGDVLTYQTTSSTSQSVNVSLGAAHAALLTTLSSAGPIASSSLSPSNKPYTSANETPSVSSTRYDIHQKASSTIAQSFNASKTSSTGSIKSEEQMSETGSVDYILDTEAFLNSLPPIKPLDIAGFVSAAKESVKKPKHDIALFDETEREYNYITDSLETQSETTVLRPLDRLVDKLLSEKGKMTVRKPMAAVTVEPLFGARAKVTSVASSGVFTGSSESELTSRDSVDVLMREKAKLEGQVEMLMAESENVMQERAELQAHVAALKQQIKLHSQKTDGAEKESMLGEIGSLRKKCFHIEQAMIDMGKIMEEKEGEAKTLAEELQLSQELCESIQHKMKELHGDMKGKEVTIQGLKNKIAELYVDVQNAMQAKMQSDSEMRSAKSDVVTLVSTKEWYQQQLHTAHDERSELQKQLSKVLAQVTSQTVIVDNLKGDNAQLRQQLSRLQQSALSEKESLARHLEKIETEMLDRETTYEEMQRERSVIEDTLNTRLESVGEDSARISHMVHLTAEMEARLMRSLEDVKRRMAQINDLEAKQTAMLKDLNASQTALMERDKTVQGLEHRLIEVEEELRSLHKDIVVKDGVILKLNEDRASAEIALSSALQEKKSVDDALETLRSDMTKVGSSFRQMKQELGSRVCDLEKVEGEKKDLMEKFEEIEGKLKQLEMIKVESNSEISGKDGAIFELTSQRDGLTIELDNLKKDMKENKSLLDAKYLETDMLSSNLVKTKQELDQRIIILEEVKLSSTEKVELVSSETQTINETPETMAEASVIEITQQQVARESKAQKEMLKQKVKAAKLRSELIKLQQEFRERQEAFDANVKEMTETLTVTLGEKERLTGDVERMQRRFDLSMVETKDQLHSQLQALAVEAESLREKKHDLETALLELQRIKDAEVAEYEAQLSALGEELRRERAAHEMREEEVAREMGLELEKERGRVAGLTQSQQNLKQHVSSVEEALARRESSLTGLQERVNEEEGRWGREEDEYRVRVESLETSLEAEREAHRQVRKQVGLKLTEKKRVSRQYEKLRMEHDCMQRDLASKEGEVTELQADVERGRNSESFHVAEVERLKSEIHEMRGEVERQRREAERSGEQVPVTMKRIETLEWTIQQRENELLSLRSHIKKTHDQHVEEVTHTNTNIQSIQSEMDALREELNAARRDKFSLHNKVSELRAALKATIHSHKVRKRLTEAAKRNGADDAITSNEPDLDIVAMETLLEDTAIKSTESKPLDKLHRCLSSLRGQISGLQREIDHHTSAMHSSIGSWTTITAQVEDLRHVMRTVCGDDNGGTVATVTTATAITEEPEDLGRVSGLIVV